MDTCRVGVELSACLSVAVRFSLVEANFNGDKKSAEAITSTLFLFIFIFCLLFCFNLFYFFTVLHIFDTLFSLWST